MLKSDGTATPRTVAMRDIGRAKRSDRTAFALGSGLSLVVAALTLWLAALVFHERVRSIVMSSEDAAQTLADAVADDIGEAVGYGIPIERLRGVDEFLARVLEADRLISAIAILDTAEAPLFASRAFQPNETQLRAAILLDDQAVGTVVAVPSNVVGDDARHELFAAAVAVALLVGILSAVCLRIAALERVNLPQARFGASAASVARGVIADFTPPMLGEARGWGRNGARLLEPLRRSYRSMMVLTEEVRALDTSRLMTQRIQTALMPLGRYVFDRPRTERVRAATPLWWPFAALSALFAARPLVASFAADRVGPNEVAFVAIGASLAANAIGLAAGLILARYTPRRGRNFYCFLGMGVAGTAIGITFVIRDPIEFVWAQFAAGLFGGWAVAISLKAEGAWLRAPWRGGLVLLAAFAVASPLGALVAQSVGRRGAFLAIGITCAVVGLLALAGPPRRARKNERSRWPSARLPWPTLLSLAAVSTAITALCDIALPVFVMPDNYAVLALMTSTAGVAAFVPLALPSRRKPWFAAAGAAGAAIAVLVALAGLPFLAAVTVLGTGAGFAIASAGARIFAPTAIAALFSGVVIAAGTQSLVATAGPLLNLDGLAFAAAATCAIALTALAAFLAAAR